MFPTIQLTSQQLAQIKAWEVGQKYVLEITVEMTGVRQAEKYDLPTQEAAEGEMQNNSIMIGTFEIKDVQPSDAEPKVEVEEENDPATYEEEYADRMDPANRPNITINFQK